MSAKTMSETPAARDPALLAAAKAAAVAAAAATLGEISFPSVVAPASPPGEVLTLGEAAELLRTSEEGVRKEAEAGRIPGRNIGGEWRFSRRAVLTWLALPEHPAVPANTGPALVDHIRRVNAASQFQETEEEAEAFIAAIYAARKADTVGGER